ncbi:MAG TPA: cytochrome c [Terriglobales bacterium]|nr:cytochrome c [Terriglobales bacterium]
MSQLRFNLRHKLMLALLAAGIVLVAGGCRQDMHNQPKYVTYRSSEFFRDGLSERQPVIGTVARGDLHADSYFYTGRNGTKEGDQFPFPITMQVMERGRERYDIYCSPCHSRVGDGNGMIVKRGYRQAANFHLPRYLTQPVGHYYDVISHGWGAMPDYAAQIEPVDRWAIAAYIRALQYAQNGTMADVPADQRGQVKDQSDVTIEGVSLQQALASGGKGSAEEISPAGSNPAAGTTKVPKGEAPQTPRPEGAHQ